MAIVEALVGVIAAMRAPAVIGSFEEIFKGFGADLPGLTRAILATRHAWWLLALAAIAIAAWIALRPAVSRAVRRRQVLAVVVYTITFGAAWLCTAIGLYLPIFRLGAVI